jgi:hypothetical protein
MAAAKWTSLTMMRHGLKIGVPSSSTTPTAHPSTETGMSLSSLIIDRTPSSRQPSQYRGHSKETEPPPANVALPSRVNVFTHSKLCRRMRAMRSLVAWLPR